MDPELASYLLTIIIASSLPGRLLPGYLADKLGPLNVQIPLTLICSILCFCWIAISSSGALVAFCVLYGLCSGAFNSLPGVTVMSLSRDLSTIGVQVGMSMAVTGCGVLVGEPIAGAILGGAAGWVGLQVFCAVVLFVSAMLMVAARLLRTGLVLTVKA